MILIKNVKYPICDRIITNNHAFMEFLTVFSIIFTSDLAEFISQLDQKWTCKFFGSIYQVCFLCLIQF